MKKKNRLLPNRKITIFYSRIGWAQTYLKQAGLLTSPKRGFFKITERGIQIIKQNPTDIDLQYLHQFSEFIDFINRSRKDESEDKPKLAKEKMTPEENMESAFEIIQEKFKDELLITIKKSTPKFFEKLVVDLLVSIGYGGSIKEAVKAIGMSGDEGVEGIIKEDLLGLDVIYIQAKSGKGMYPDLRFKNLPARYKDKEQNRESFLLQVHFLKMQ
jgi:restriction system protein